MTSKLTRERLEKIKSWRETYGAGSNVMLPAEEAEELARMALAAMDSEPVGAAEPISFDEWSRKCALQITLCYPDFREKAKYIWDSARETQQPAPVVPDDVLDALQKVARIRADLNNLDGDCRGVGSCLWEAEERLLEIVAQRSAMLSGGKS